MPGQLSYFKKNSYELKGIFSLRDFIDDYDDFTTYLKVLDGVQEKAKLEGKDKDADKKFYDKVKSALKLTEEELKKLEYEKKKARLPKEDLERFRVSLLSYLLFRKKEKEKKLNALKESQANLPVAAFRNEIIESVAKNQITIIAGDTGCGKSTQVPQFLMDAHYSRIACTQPRRIACMALAKRVAYETQNKFGDKIGYQIRFERKRNQDTKIIFITEGLLLRQVALDGMLSDYDVIILDEVHERNLHMDFLLGVLKCLSYQRKDLKIVLMSATINISLFTDYFKDVARIIQVPGRLFPIEVHFAERTAEKDRSKSKINPEPYIKILRSIENKYPKTERGDVLIFVSGIGEIESLISSIKEYNEGSKVWIPLPLHSSLSLADQNKVFNYAPTGFRKCVVSTNIAETSVTIDGIRFVIDSGLMKEMSYDPTCKISRLKEVVVSKASAEQRKGRAGRTGPGVCHRLYTRKDYDAFDDYTTPEIKRVPLDSLVLQMITLGLPDARKFPFVEPPDEESLENTITALKQHGALTNDEKLTPIGETLSKLPVDIPIGKMLISGAMFEQLELALSLAATLSVQTPFTNNAYRDESCERARRKYESDHGDPITLLNCLRAWLEEKNAHKKHSNTRQWCSSLGLEEQRFYEMCKIRSQFQDHLIEFGSTLTSKHEEFASSADRILRIGDLKILREMKRAANSEEERRRKFLRPDGTDVEGNAKKTDVRDIEFRLKNNQSKIQGLIIASSACKYTDLTILKLILCSGLYPQVAIPDEFNYHKGVSEYLFHTKDKPYVFLHPLSYFGNHPEVLQLDSSQMETDPKFDSKAPFSSHHQVLFYMTLLETNRPYLVHTMRMPAAHSIILFANEIHSNSDFTRILCDSWIQFRFRNPTTAESFVKRVIKLRSQWEQIINLQYKQNSSTARTIQKELTKGLISFMTFKTEYSIKRVLAADLKVMFVGPGLNVYEGENPLHEYQLKPNEKVGGTEITSYFTFNSLDDDSPPIVLNCEHCDIELPFNALERMRHLKQCAPKTEESEKKFECDNEVKNPNALKYKCDQCKKTLYLTPVEVLKHKKSHL